MSKDPPRGRPLGRRMGRTAERLQPGAAASPVVVPPAAAPEAVEFETNIPAVAAVRRDAPLASEGREVPRAERRRRAVGAAISAVGAVTLTLLAVAILGLPEPPRGTGEVAVADTDLVSAAVADQRYNGKEIKVIERAPPAPRLPADAVLHFREAHRGYGTWRLHCTDPETGRISNTFTSEGQVDRASLEILIPQVPPRACRVRFAGPGWREVRITAGDYVECRIDGNLVCRR